MSSVSHTDGRARTLRHIDCTHKQRMALYRECEIQLPPLKLGDFASPLRALRGLHDVEISTTLLGNGGERNAYLMRFVRDNNFTTSAEEWVVKESRHEREEAEEDEFHRKALVTQSAAKELANKFNEQAEELGLVGMPKVSYMTCCFIATGAMERRPGEAADPQEPPVRSLFAERKIDGEFRKWNTNFGATVQTRPVPESEQEGGAAHREAQKGQPRAWRFSSDLVPQAFSHFTIEYSQRPLSTFVGPSGKRGRCLVCDLQGCFDKRENTFLLSDPVMHSDLGEPHLFGATDNGAKGIALFLRSHKCNDVCRMLRLEENTHFVEENVGQLENSSVNTSFISVVQTRHLRERQDERSISKRELQAAKKHGTKERQASGTIKHQLGDLKFITSKDMQVGISAMRREGYQREGHPSEPARSPSSDQPVVDSGTDQRHARMWVASGGVLSRPSSQTSRPAAAPHADRPGKAPPAQGSVLQGSALQGSSARGSSSRGSSSQALKAILGIPTSSRGGGLPNMGGLPHMGVAHDASPEHQPEQLEEEEPHDEVAVAIAALVSAADERSLREALLEVTSGW